MPDRCAGSSVATFTGPFEPYYVLQVAVETPALTLGTCGGTENPTAAPETSTGSRDAGKMALVAVVVAMFTLGWM